MTTGSIFWVVVIAGSGGVLVLLGLLMEKFSEKSWHCNLDDFRRSKARNIQGEWLVIIGIVVEIAVACWSANDEWHTRQMAIKNDPLVQPISDMSATVRFFVKGTQRNELTNWETEVSKIVGTMFLIDKKGKLDSTYFTTAFDTLTADSFVRKHGNLIGEPNFRDNQGYLLKFHSENWGAFAGIERPVKQIAEVHWVRMEVNFLPNGSVITAGGIELVVNNVKKLFTIFPQTDTNRPDGTPTFPYIIYATNVDETPVQ